MGLEAYSLGQTTLEQAFLHHARTHTRRIRRSRQPSDWIPFSCHAEHTPAASGASNSIFQLGCTQTRRAGAPIRHRIESHFAIMPYTHLPRSALTSFIDTCYRLYTRTRTPCYMLAYNISFLICAITDAKFFLTHLEKYANKIFRILFSNMHLYCNP